MFDDQGNLSGPRAYVAPAGLPAGSNWQTKGVGSSGSWTVLGIQA